MRSSGFSATSGSRLLWSMRRAASCCHPLQLIWRPRGAWIAVVRLMKGSDTIIAPCRREQRLSQLFGLWRSEPNSAVYTYLDGRFEGLVLDRVEIDFHV